MRQRIQAVRNLPFAGDPFSGIQIFSFNWASQSMQVAMGTPWAAHMMQLLGMERPFHIKLKRSSSSSTR